MVTSDSDQLRQCIASMVLGEPGLRELLWTLGYEYEDSYLPLPDWLPRGLLADSPRIVASAFRGDFSILWFPLEALDPRLEERIAASCLQTHPHAFLLFSTPEYRSWHIASLLPLDCAKPATFRVIPDEVTPAIVARFSSLAAPTGDGDEDLIAFGSRINAACSTAHRPPEAKDTDNGSHEATDSIHWWLSVMGQFPMLTASEARRIALRAYRGDRKARNRLVEGNLRLAFWVAKKYSGSGLPLSDLVQEAHMGLITAAEKYDPSYGVRFATYAVHWIRQAVSRAVSNQSRLIRIPAYLADSARGLDRARWELCHKLFRQPTIAEICEATCLPRATVERLLRLEGDVLSLGEFRDEGGDFGVRSLWGDDVVGSFSDWAIREELASALRVAVERLDPRHCDVVMLRFGLEDGCPHSLQEVGDHFGLSRERIRQILIRALGQLRQPPKENIATIVQRSSKGLPANVRKTPKAAVTRGRRRRRR